ncbi:hypothetical protein ABZ901_29330 [Actinacidiphila alni]|uniref:hypothetical protein n=1 Tax=Actinacidiphila alni TaxID=380248 RepID=UPI0033C85743
MNASRILTAAAAGSFLLAAAAPAAMAAEQSADLGSTLSSTAVTAATTGEQVKGATSSVLGDYKVDQKVQDVQDVAQAGTDAVNAANDLVH